MKKFFDGPVFKMAFIFCLLIVVLAASACVTHAPRLQKEPALKANAFETNPSGLAIDVLDLDWRYNNQKTTITVSGTVRNNSGQALQAITLIGRVSDELGRPLFEGRSYLSPTYLKDGAEAEFEFVGLVTPGMAKVKFIRVVTLATILD